MPDDFWLKSNRGRGCCAQIRIALHELGHNQKETPDLPLKLSFQSHLCLLEL
jgi:hypothetical protein